MLVRVHCTLIQLKKILDISASLSLSGGAWKQGWDVKYTPLPGIYKSRKRKVFVVPHSHNDSGR